MAATDTTETAPRSWADSPESWIAVTHDATLPSGAKVTFRDLTLSELATLDELPEDLLEVVVQEWADPGSAVRLAAAPFAALPEKPSKKQVDAADTQSKDALRKLAAVNRHLVSAALVSPRMTVDQLEQVPMADLEMLAALINRAASTDAVGRHVGVVPLDQFQVILEAHGQDVCAAGCEACEEAGRALSTVRR